MAIFRVSKIRGSKGVPYGFFSSRVPDYKDFTYRFRVPDNFVSPTGIPIGICPSIIIARFEIIARRNPYRGTGIVAKSEIIALRIPIGVPGFGYRAPGRAIFCYLARPWRRPIGPYQPLIGPYRAGWGIQGGGALAPLGRRRQVRPYIIKKLQT